jgi:hypothetical protein
MIKVAGKIPFFRDSFNKPEKRNCYQKVLKRILKEKHAPDVPVFQEFFLKSPKATYKKTGKNHKGGNMGNLRKLKDIVQEFVDKGATSVEEVHKSIAKLPLEVLESIEGIEEPAKGIKEIQQKTIGSVYDIIRQVNSKVAEIAEEIISKVEDKEDKEE